MAEQMDISTHDEKVFESSDVSNNNSSENNGLSDACENLEKEANLLNGKSEFNGASVSTSNLREEEMQFDHEPSLHEVEHEIAKEIAETAVETIRNKLEYLHDKCMECGDLLNEFFQQVFNALNNASKLRKWSRVADLHEMLTNSEPYYKPLLMIMQAIEGVQDTLTQNERSLNKYIVNKVIRTCNTLEGTVDELMSLVPESI